MNPAGPSATPPVGESSGGGLRQRRQRSDHQTELALLPISKGVKTDAQVRLYLQHEQVIEVNDNFDDPTLVDRIAEQVTKAPKDMNHMQIEFDVNIERFEVVGDEDTKINRELLPTRLAGLTFRFDRFLRSLKHKEDADKLAEEKQKQIEEMPIPTADTIDSSEMPANMVEHLMQWGTEKHLEVVKRYLLGSDEALGVTVTFKDLTVTQARPKQGCLPLGKPKPASVELLKHLYGVIPAGRLTLLLGAPHSGKTQLLHALSRHTKNKGPITLTGEVFYNSHSFKKVYPSNFCTVVEQIDQHIPILTVRETLEFAHKCRNRSRSNDPEQKARSKQLLKNRVDLVMAILGLTRVADTVIGNESLKGISGGEMRRVTLGEMLVAGSKVLLLDEVSTGLDSAATYDITKSILAMCKVMNVSSVISLLQPPPETFDLFQDLILMADGNIVYHGARDKALEYFNALGREMPRVMDVADFLIETSLDRSDELVLAYKQTDQYKFAVQVDVAQQEYIPADNLAAQQREKMLVEADRYAFGFFHLLKVVFQRQMMIMLRNKAFILARLTQNLVMGLLIGALFFQIPFDQYYLVAMVLSQGLTLSGFSMMALLGDVLTSRNTYYKQSRESFFPALAYVLADYLVGLPFSLMDAFILGTISYFMAGLSTSENGRPYFIFLIIFITFGVCMATLTRFFGYVSPNQTAAFSIAVFVNIMSLIFGGAIATPNVIPGWWIWYYWVFSPVAWAYRSLLQNEFLSNTYQAQCDNGECPNNLQGQCVRYCGRETCPQPYPQMLCGEYFLHARQVETDPMFTWLGAGILWIYTALFILMSVWALVRLRYDVRYAELNEDLELAKTARQEEEEAKAKLDAESQAMLEQQQPEEAASLIENPPTLVWRNLYYTIEVRAPDENYGEKRMMQLDLLKNVNGFAKPYEMTALMGSSGAGKTTLLDCLCYRKTMGKIRGDILVHGKQVVPRMFKKQVGYVEQFGIHNPTSTVRESLEFSAKLRLPSVTPQSLRDTIVDKVMFLLQIGPIANTRVMALSFEENKRLTIAVELCAAAKILFADEPTSGLTSKEAILTMAALDRVSKLGVPVICTIHQPSSEIFQKFTRLLLLKRGGEIVFFGKIKELIEYFEAIPEVPRLPNGLNPATWMLDVIGAGVGRSNSTAELDFADVYRLSDLHTQNEAELEALLVQERPSLANIDDAMSPASPPPEKRHKESVQLERIPEEYNCSYWEQLRLLVKRNRQDFWRNPTYAHLRWVIILFFALVTGTLFLQQNLGTAAGVQSRVNVINLMLLLTANHNGSTIVPFVFSRRALFYREKNSGMYAGFVYALAHQLLEDVYVMWEVALSTTVFYFAVGMTATASAFFYYIFLLYFFVLLITFLGATVAAGSAVQGAASLISSLVVQLLVLFSGVAVPGNRLDSWLLGGYYISPVRWAMEGLVVSQFTTYEDVICNPSSNSYTWQEGEQAAEQCVEETINFLSDVNKMACCDVSGNLPISAKAYTLTGWTYASGTVTQAWLGGDNGYRINWTGYDYLFVVLAMFIIRILHVLLNQFVSHQRR